MTELLNQYPKIFARKEDAQKILLKATELLIKINDERVLAIKIIPERDAVNFQAYAVNETDERVHDKNCIINVALGASNVVNLKLPFYPRDSMEEILCIKPTYRIYVVMADTQKMLIEADALTLQFDHERCLDIRFRQFHNEINLQSYCVDEAGERIKTRFTIMDLHPRACNVFDLKFVAKTSTGSCPI